jgi:hypothetical protein
MLRLPIDSPYSSFLPPAAGSSHAFFQAHVAAVCVLRACCVRVCVRSLQLFLFAAPTLFADAVLDRCASLTHRPQGAAMGVSLLAACAALPHRCTASRALLCHWQQCMPCGTGTVHAPQRADCARWIVRCAMAALAWCAACPPMLDGTRFGLGSPPYCQSFALARRLRESLGVRAMCSAKRCEASDDDSDAGTSEGSCDESP